MSTPTVISSHRAACGEGPCWIDGKLFWIDNVGRSLIIHNPDGPERVMTLPQLPGCIAPRRAGGLVIAWEKGFALLDPKTLAHQAICDPEADRPDTRFNDGGVDPAGRFWAGTMHCDGKSAVGRLYMLDAAGRAHSMISGVTISNGLTWSHDGRTMYYIDSPTQVVQAFDFDVASGEISNRRVIVRIPGEGVLPDGMAIDENGNLWIALWNGNGVVCHDPRTGEQLARIDLPVSNVTSCAFGGKDLRTLFITSATAGLSEKQLQEQPLAGRLFACELDVRGWPTRRCEL